jgi:probable HAF family extracellular repeat protein
MSVRTASRLGRSWSWLVIGLVLSLVTAGFAAPAEHASAATDTLSTTGVHIVVVPVPDDLFGNPGGGVANAINDSGSIVGTAEQPATRAFVWNGVGHPQLIEAPNPSDPSYGVDINDLTEIVGTYGSPTRAFLWDGTSSTDLGTPPGATSGGGIDAKGIDDLGNIVGTYDATVSATCQPATLPGGKCSYYRVEGASQLTPMLAPSADQHALATDVDGGEIVGNGWSFNIASDSYFALPGQALADDAGTIVGTVETENGIRAAILSDPPVILPTLGGSFSVGHGYGHGWVVGSSETSTGETHAFYWSAADGIVDLGTLGGAGSDAFGVNADGLIVGRAQDGALWRPVVWDPLGIYDPDFPPEIAPIGPQVVGEGDSLTVTPEITDPDGDPFTVIWTNLPDGATQVGTSLQWDSAVAGSYVATVTAVQDGQPLNTTSVDVPIQVVAGNHAPVLDPIGDHLAQVGVELSIAASASDADGSAQQLTYLMIFGTPTAPLPIPGDASIDPASGLFTWTPTSADIGDHTVTIGVQDNGSPPLGDYETFTITVGTTPTSVQVSIVEGVGVGDSVIVAGSIVIHLAEGIGVGDNPSVRPPVLILLTEGVGVADDVAVRPPVQILISEGVGVLDVPAVAGPLHVTVEENVGVGDAITITTIDLGSLLDTSGGPTSTLVVGETATLSGSGFDPLSGVDIEIRSTPMSLGSTMSDATGNIEVEITIPDVLPAGEHTIAAVGMVGGHPHEVQIPVLILSPVVVALSSDNPVSVPVTEPGGFSGRFDMAFDAREVYPGLVEGGLADAPVGTRLEPVGPGGVIEPASCTAKSDDDLLVTCSFDEVPVGTYTVVGYVGGLYSGFDESVLTVYDPSLGFTTGGGWFSWPDSDERTNFGYTMKYNKKGTNVQGSFLLIRHLANGFIYRVKSNAVDGLALSAPGDDLAWATFSGKATYLAPGMDNPEGNNSFVVYVEDDPDRFWVQVKDKDGEVIDEISVQAPASETAVGLSGGTIVVPHETQKGPKKE